MQFNILPELYFTEGEVQDSLRPTDYELVFASVSDHQQSNIITI